MSTTTTATHDLAINTSSLDDDSTRFAEMILAKARFHRILVESLEQGVKEDRKKEKKEKKTSKKKKSEKKRRKSLTKDKKDKSKKGKVKKGTEEEKGSEEMKIAEMLEMIKKQKLKITKDKDKKEDKKKKKKKSKKKKKKRDSKTKTVTIDLSDDDESCSESYNCWWSIGAEEKSICEEDEKQKNKKSPIASKTSPKKGTKRSLKKGTHPYDLSETDHSQKTDTERTATLSESWSFSSPIARKVSEEFSLSGSTNSTTNNSASVMWWDNVKDSPPKSPNCTLPSRTPASTPTTACKLSPMLLTPSNDTSDSDYDDVSIFSEESLSEQILDDLSCILDCSDESGNEFDETLGSPKRSSRDISAKSYDSSSICSGPFSLRIKAPEDSTDVDPLDLLDPEDIIDPEDILDPADKLDPEDICITPTPEKKHLSSVKILSISPSPYSEKGNTSPCPSTPSSNASSCKSSPGESCTSSPKSSSGSRTEPTRNSPLKLSPQEVEEETGIDGIARVPTKGLFGNIKAELPCPSTPSSNASSCESGDNCTSSPKSSSGSPTSPLKLSPQEAEEEKEAGIDGIARVPIKSLFGHIKARLSPKKNTPKKEVGIDGIAPVPRQGLFGNRKVQLSPRLPSSAPLA